MIKSYNVFQLPNQNYADDDNKHKMVGFIGLVSIPELREPRSGDCAMAKRNKSSVLDPNILGHPALVFDEDDVVRLLRSAVEREGGQTAFAKHHGIDRVFINMILNGKKPFSGSVVKALGLRKVYVAE